MNELKKMSQEELFEASERRNEYLLEKKQELEAENSDLKNQNELLLKQVQNLKECVK